MLFPPVFLGSGKCIVSSFGAAFFLGSIAGAPSLLGGLGLSDTAFGAPSFLEVGGVLAGFAGSVFSVLAGVVFCAST
ncbi:hypothetical protein D3C81_1322710 [compost metagenome]